MFGYDGDSKSGMTKEAIWKALINGGFKFAKQPK
jgi:hypothetical protein